MKPCALCGERPRACEGMPLCSHCNEGYLGSPECERQLRVWEATGGVARPNPDPWIAIDTAAEADYVRRIQSERRNGGAK